MIVDVSHLSLTQDMTWYPLYNDQPDQQQHKTPSGQVQRIQLSDT